MINDQVLVALLIIFTSLIGLILSHFRTTAFRLLGKSFEVYSLAGVAAILNFPIISTLLIVVTIVLMVASIYYGSRQSKEINEEVKRE